MLLKFLELQGFKTFPEKTKLSFNEGITAVVGPNGSGKSNISDAIRWVLGEQSTKTLRCAKMEDVIFSGTENRKPRGFAQATLIMCNADRKLQFDEDEVSVTRRYYRSGESEYLINGKIVRLKDVHELFMDTGLGRDGYSIISQGKIDSVVASKSEDRREIFEEAAGISRYRYRKIEAERKLNSAEENLLRLNDILRELEERVGPLKEQSEKAKEYLNIANRKKALEIGVWLSFLDESSKILKEQNAKIEISRNQYDEVEQRIEKIKSKTEKIGESMRTHTSNIDKLRRETAICEEETSKKTGEICVFKNDILHNNENIERIKAEVAGMKGAFSELDEEMSQKKIKIEKYKTEKEKKEEILSTYNSDMEIIFNDITEISKEIECLSSELMRLNKEISSKEAGFEFYDANSDDLNGKVNALNEKISAMGFELDETLNKFNEYTEKLENRQNYLNEKRNSLHELESRIFEKRNKNDELKATADNFSLDAHEQMRKAKLLNEMEKNFEGFSQSVKFIMKEAENGSIPGIYGPISKIIKVPDKYAVAVETALGVAMQNIVVETDECAKAAIERLKSRNAGRATFLPVETIKGNLIDGSDFKNCDGFIEICGNLCSCEEKFKGILNYLLGKIIVADNLDNAVKLAKRFSHRFRVVTLDGQVINAGGSLTGGSKVRSAGALSRKAEIEKIQKLANELNAKAEKAAATLENSLNEQKILIDNMEILKKDVAEKDRERAELFSIVTKYSLKRDSLEGALENLKSEKIGLCEKVVSMNDDKIKNAKIIESMSEKINRLKINLSDMKKNEESKSLKKDSLSAQIHAANMEILSLDKDIKSVEYEIDSAAEREAEKKQKCKDFEDQVAQLSAKNDDICAKINECEQEIAGLRESLSEKAEAIDRLTNERMDFEKSITGLRNEEREKSTEREKIALEVARLEERRDNSQAEYDRIIAKLWDEYELTKREAMEAYDKVENIQKAKIDLNELKTKIKNLGTVNVAAIEEYKSVSERYEFMNEQVKDVGKSKKELYNLIEKITVEMKNLFTDRFDKINKNFGEVFRELFGGGKAELKLTQPEDVLNSGIEISVNPPGKIVTHLEALSGGEKALVAITLYFAIMKVSPSPFCVLDEIEAALDEVNVDRFASYLRKMNKKTQFIVISHRRGTMEEADVLYGVTMQNEGISKLLELRAFELAKNFVKG